MSLHTLDVRHQLCPLPVIRTQNKIKALDHGDILVVVCTDPGTINDIPAWCRVHGHKVIDTNTTDNEIKITIETNKSI